MGETKFKIGDRVRAIYTSGGGGVQAGEVFVVTSIDDGDIRFFNPRVGRHDGWGSGNFELVTPAFTISTDKHYRTRSGKPTGRVSKGDTGFEAVVDGHVRIFDDAGGAVHGGDDIVEEWAPQVGERVVEAEPKQYDFLAHWRDFWQTGEGALEDNSFVVTKVNGNWVHCSNRVDGNGPLAAIDHFEPVPVAAPTQPATLKLREGVAYKAANGAKVGPLINCGRYWNSENRTGCEGNPGHYTGSGISASNGILPREEWRSEFDLIAEWVDEPASAPVAAQIDAIAEEYGPVVASDNTATTVTISVDTGNLHEELDELIAKLKKIKKLQRAVGLAA